jgi:hypothetical protein
LALFGKASEFIKIALEAPEAHNSAVIQTITNGDTTMSNIPKINLRNSLTECGQSIRKENAGKFQNYGILDCKASIAAGKFK